NLVLGESGEGKAQKVQFVLRGRIEEIALIALGIAGTKQAAPPVRELAGLHIMAGGERLRAQIARGLQKVRKLHTLVASDARHRRFTGDIAFDEGLDYGFAESILIIEDEMRDAEPGGDRAGVVNIAAGAAGAFALRRFAVIIKLQGYADDVIAGALEECGDDRGIDAARHSDDNARRPSRDVQIQ